MGLWEIVNQYARPVVERFEDFVGIEHGGSAPTPPAAAPAPASPPTVPPGTPSSIPPRSVVPCPPGGGPTPPAVKLSGAAGGNAGAVTPEVEFTNFFNRSDRPNVERAVREVLGLRDNQPLPGPLTVSFTVSCRPGIGEIGLVTLDDVGFRLPKGVTREQLEYAVRRTLNCNPVPLYAVPSMANNHQTVVIGGRPAPAPTGDAPVQVS